MTLIASYSGNYPSCQHSKPAFFPRPQYYGDESFYHAVVVAASRRGWFIAFSGFEEEGLQDTKVGRPPRPSPRPLFHHTVAPLQ